VLFTTLGLAVASLARTRSRLAIAYVVVAILAFLIALWQAGFAFARVDGVALGVALFVYAIPFWIVMRRFGSFLQQQRREIREPR